MLLGTGINSSYPTGVTGTTLSIQDVPQYTASAFTATFQFSDDVTGFDISDIDVTNGTPSAFATVSANEYTALITPTAEGMVTIEVVAGAALDSDTNPTLGAVITFSYNTTDLIVTPALASIVYAGSVPTFPAGMADQIVMPAGASITYTGQTPVVTTGTAGTSASSFITTYASGTDGFSAFFAKDGTDQPSIYISDAGTPANDFDALISADLGAASGLFTMTAPSPKNLLQSDGDLKYSAHNGFDDSDDLTTQGATLVTTTTTQMTETANYGKHSVSMGGASAFLLTGQVLRVRAKFEAVSGTSDFGGIAVWDGVATKSCYVDLTDGTLGTPTNCTAAATADGGGWILEIVFTCLGSTGNVKFHISNTATTSNYTGDVGNTIAITNAQMHYAPADETFLSTSGSPLYALPIEYDTAGDALGIRNEPAATNLFVHGNDISDAAWTHLNGQQGTATTGVSGQADSFKWESTTASSGQHYVYDEVSLTSGNFYCTSFYVAAAELSFVQIAPAGSEFTARYQNFNLSTGALGNNDLGAEATAGIEDMGGGYYRCWVTAESTGPTGSGFMTIGMLNADTASRLPAQAYSIGDGIYLERLQFEEVDNVNSVPTSYIHTGGSTATRAKDAVTKLTSSFPHADGAAGFVYFEGSVEDVSTLQWLWSLNDNTNNNRTYASISSDVETRNVTGGTADVADSTTGTATDDTTFKHAMSIDTNDFAHTLNGAAVETDAATTPASGLLTLDFGQAQNGTNNMYGLIRAFVYIPERVSDGNLVTVTTL